MPKPSNPTSEPVRIVYRDGAGRELPDEDLLMRARAQADLTASLSRRVVYEGHVRSGQFIYLAGAVRIAFDQEMGSGDCKALIFVPAARTWAVSTGTPLAERDEIVRFVAEAAARHAGTRYVLSDAFIEIY